GHVRAVHRHAGHRRTVHQRPAGQQQRHLPHACHQLCRGHGGPHPREPRSARQLRRRLRRLRHRQRLQRYGHRRGRRVYGSGARCSRHLHVEAGDQFRRAWPAGGQGPGDHRHVHDATDLHGKRAVERTRRRRADLHHLFPGAMMMQISSIRSRQGGVTLIELMVAMVLGLIIIGGVFAVYLSTADARRTNETIARIQEDARFALRTVKDDLRLAGNWGKTRTTGTLDGFKGLPTQLDPISGDCEDRWYIDLVQAVWAANGTNPFSGTCLPAHLANTDMLAVRYAAPEEATTLTSGVMYVRSDMARGEVFDGGVGATGSYSVDAEDHALVTHLYYVRPYTRVAGDNLPSLRRIRL